ncbi:ribosomal-protein-alanine N-acetyltransferase [Roseivivax lentus]|uniref:Ribosomal-protein-alanine N-acetyltransferase n=1 Tax=Roseivivax lentus TaxID=633194 RepID=A0A1N7JK63_9RHOB|nr:GNAT family N-acetyltransferase [Roseivivax lentus]SIS49636.1 ribosomal-protein-alanine N-acetyltransferase [Roseivivax lentus]
MLVTDRLILRAFEPRDRDAFVALNSDPQVMHFFGRPYSAQESLAQLSDFAQAQARRGYAFSAVERRSDHRVIGMCGLSRVDAGLPCAPATEIGWRLRPEAWGHGYATEAARAWLAHGFDALGLPEIVAFAPKINVPSRRVMARIGMRHDPDEDFLHPDIARDSELNPMVLCRIDKARWRALKEPHDT